MLSMKELLHRYGSQVHIIEDSVLSTWLTRLSHPDTFQPTINNLVRDLYVQLLQIVMSNEFPTCEMTLPTRMTTAHPQNLLKTRILDPNQSAVTVNLARAGTYPSQICFDMLNTMLNPSGVRQDHILASRMTNSTEQVTGTELSGTKIGGSIEGRVVLFPDPMGATGSTLTQALQLYENYVEGRAHKFIALHLIITPEYLSRLKAAHPELIIYALRLDRGLSSEEVLKTVPGTHWELEKGLNDKQYIVPGAGGLGEIMNNSYI